MPSIHEFLTFQVILIELKFSFSILSEVVYQHCDYSGGEQDLMEGGQRTGTFDAMFPRK